MVVHELLRKARLARRHREVQARTPGQRGQTYRHRPNRRPVQGPAAAAPTESFNQPLPQRRPARQRCLDALDQLRWRLDAQVSLLELRTHLTVLRAHPLTLLAAGQMALELERFGQ